MHHLYFVVEQAVGVAVQSDRGVMVSHYVSNGPDIYSALDRTSGKSVSEGVKIEFSHTCALGKLFKRILV